MSNIHGLHSSRDNESDSEDDENNRFVGGIGDRGGGSGLAVRPNPEDIFQQAEGATADDSAQVRRTITMYRDGFVVDDGPYRRLDDPANADFLRSLASGRTPRELQGEGDVVVGLIDKRNQEYKEEFRSFSGQGASLGVRAPSTSTENDSSVFDATELAGAPAPVAVDESQPATQIQVRLTNGQRLVIRTNLSASVANLAASIVHSASGTSNEISGSFRLVAGFPPKPLTDVSVSVEEAGLKGAQVSLQKV